MCDKSRLQATTAFHVEFDGSPAIAHRLPDSLKSEFLTRLKCIEERVIGVEGGGFYFTRRKRCLIRALALAVEQYERLHRQPRRPSTFFHILGVVIASAQSRGLGSTSDGPASRQERQSGSREQLPFAFDS